MVDPYDWLGIPQAQRPPTPYQLLALEESVVEATEIRSAADRQLRRILPHMAGENALEAEGLWTELEEARDLLLDPDRRAHLDVQPQAEQTEQTEQTEPPELPEAPTISAEWEEPAAPAPTTAAEPWWKNATEASVGGDVWWKQSLPIEAVPPPPSPPPPVAPPVLPKPVRAHEIDPDIAAIGTGVPVRKRKSSGVLVLAIGLLVAGAIGGGVYYVQVHKSSPTVPKDLPVAVIPKSDPKTKSPDRIEPKRPAPIPEVPLPKGFADALRTRTFKGHAGAVNGLAVASAGSRFASVGTDKTLRIWSVTKDESEQRHTFISPAIGVCWCDKDRLIFAADGLTLAAFDAGRNTAPKLSESPKGGVTSLGVAADGSKALTGLTDGYARLWDTSTGRPDEWPVAANGAINVVDISPDGNQALFATAQGPVSLWDLASRTRKFEWTPHDGGTIAVRFSPDGTRAATAGPDGNAAIYDLATRNEICRLEGHVGPVTAIEWLPDGRQVVTASVDTTARLWTAETGQPMQWSQALEGKGSCLAVDPGGRFILAGTSTGNIHIFPLPRVKPESLSDPVAKPPSEPLPVPSAESVATAIANVHKELAREFGYNRPDDMALLADNLRRRGLLERVSPALRFGLLQEARTLAVKAGDPATAFKSIESLASWFDIDELALKASTFADLPEAVDGNYLLKVGLAAAERAESDARPEVVRRVLARIPENLPARIPADQLARLKALRTRSTASETEFKNVLRALDVLRNAADDQSSNQIYGAYLCLTRQDWANGLPRLVKGNNPRLIEAARTDLQSPTEPKAQHQLGELWYGLALDSKDHRAKRAMLGRARFWFERERASKLELIDDIKARARIDAIAKLDVPGKDPSTLPIFSPVLVRRNYETIGSDVLGSEWKLGSGSAAGPNGVVLPSGSPVLQPRFGLAPGSKLTLAFTTDGRELRIACAGQEIAFAGSGQTLRLVIERSEDKLNFSASNDGAAPTLRQLDLSPAYRGPTFMTFRLTGTSIRAGSALLTSAMLRGPASLPLPRVE